MTINFSLKQAFQDAGMYVAIATQAVLPGYGYHMGGYAYEKAVDLALKLKSK